MNIFDDILQWQYAYNSLYWFQKPFWKHILARMPKGYGLIYMNGCKRLVFNYD